MIFWTVTTTITAAIIYDKREKKRATARWAHAVEHLAKEPLPGSDPNAAPRKLTIYLSAPPGDGLRTAQDHFTEYVKPVLAASGLDWEYVQGRMQGDVRAVVAERVRKTRRHWEDAAENPEHIPTDDEFLEAYRKNRHTPEYDGIRGDVVIGRHTWKEYVRGLHEGWLGPLTAPPEPAPIPETPKEEDASAEKPAQEEAKPQRPPQPKPYNSPNDYAASSLPLLTPAEFAPSMPIREPHLLGFLNTPTRLRRFFNRRALADEIGREVAAVCLCTYREYREQAEPEGTIDSQYEQQKALNWEEKDWVKTVWKEDKPKDAAKGSPAAVTPAEEIKEKIWTRDVVMDPRIATRMRRFELQPEDEVRARAIVVPEEEVEGWIKGSVRGLFHWGAAQFTKEKKPTVIVDDE